MLHLLAPKDDAMWPDDYPEVLGEPEDNEVLATIGLIFVDLAALAAMYLPIAKMFVNQIASMLWYEWMMASFALAALLVTIWPWIAKVEASNDPTDATTFRSWRVNLLIGSISAIISILICGFYAVSWILGAFAVGTTAAILSAFTGSTGGLFSAYFTATWYTFVAFTLGLIFGIAGGFMLYFNKHFWYNYDPEGMRLTVDFDYFGPDVVIEDKEEEPVIEDGDNGDADWASDDDFW